MCVVGDRSLMREAVEYAEDESGITQNLDEVRRCNGPRPTASKQGSPRIVKIELTLTPCDVDMV